MSSRHSPPVIHSDLVAASTLKSGRKWPSGWVAPGETVAIRGHEISCGMFYLGSMLYTPDGRRVTNEPSIINPAKPASPAEPQPSPYWYGGASSYQSMSPGERWRYLEWLAAGRPLPATPNFISVFLCGLERRALVDTRFDPSAREDIPAIEAEVNRLLQQQNAAYMFGYQAKQFLLALRLAKGELDGQQQRPPAPVESWDVPLELKIGLGGFALRGEPLPAKWALAWTRSDPNIRLSTPARRCTKEFNELFLKRYIAEHGDGILLRNNKTRIRFHYSPSNRSLWGAVTMEAPNLPDVTRQRKATWALSMVALAVSQELDPYSRWVSMHHDRTSLRATALLPAEIAGRRKAVKEFRQWADQKLDGAPHVALPVKTFVDLWSRSTTGNMTRREAELLSEFLERIQFGIEPDVRFGGVEPSRTDTLVFFRLPEPGRPGLSEDYSRALLLLRLSLVVALDKGGASAAQVQSLERALWRVPGLTANEYVRLHARLRWSLTRPVDTKGLKQQSAVLMSEKERQQVARFLVALAGVESRIGPEELKTLEKVYNLLGLKHQEIARDVHAIATARSEPVTIIPADENASGYTLPAERPEPPKDRVRLSSERVASIEAETRLVGAVLGDVFAEPEPVGPAPEEVTAGTESPVAALDLDEAHLGLARQLAERNSWSRAEVEELCGQFGLLAAGAIEMLNEAAFDLADEPFLEGDDPLDVNTDFVAEFLHA